MSANLEIPALQRVTFFSGQKLTAADLTALERTNRELRWLHNRSLHDWGIGVGLDVKSLGPTAVEVQPGYGIDSLGREIVLTERRPMTVPAKAGTVNGKEQVYYLVTSYVGDADQKVTETGTGICAPDQAVRLSEEPALEWRAPEDLNEGQELVLAQIWVLNCRMSREPSTAPRHNARPPGRQLFSAGRTSPTDTAWEVLEVNQARVGVKVTVDTSSGRFRRTPQYLANVGGYRVLRSADLGNLVALGFTSVANPTPQSFVCEVYLPDFQAGTPPVNPGSVRDPDKAPKIFRRLNWHVSWMGIEMEP